MGFFVSGLWFFKVRAPRSKVKRNPCVPYRMKFEMTPIEHLSHFGLSHLEGDRGISTRVEKGFWSDY
jgi:hypothetical protein